MTWRAMSGRPHAQELLDKLGDVWPDSGAATDLGKVRRTLEGFRVCGSDHPGGAVQIDTIKPMLKPPGTKRLKLNHNKVLSNFAFKFNLRRYTRGRWCGASAGARRQGLTLVHFSAQLERLLCDRGAVRGCCGGIRGV